MTKLPRLFVNGAFSRNVNPVSVSITENIIPLSTASMILPKGEELPARSWVELFTPYGSAGMYRVRSPKDAYGQETSTAELEHMIAEVGDSLVRDEISEMMSASTAVSTVFGYYNGSLWRLGSYSAIGNGQVAVEAKYDSVLNVLLSILEQKPECMMTFDFSTTPWTVNIVSRGTSVVAEGRLSRNVSSATVTYDDSDLTTRVWYQVFSEDSSGNPTSSWTYTDADTIGTYGVIEGKVNTSRDMTSGEISATVNAFVKAHKNPKVSVSIQATELYNITGSRIDKFVIGDLMRLALPDYNTTVELNITSISWNNVYDDPVMTIHLGDEDETIVTFLHNLDATGSGSGVSSGRGGGKAAGKSDEAWKEYRSMWSVTDELIQGVAQHVDKNNSILEQAGMQLDSQGILFYADDNVNNVASKLNVTASAIRSEVAAAESNIHTEIAQTASNIRLEVSKKSAVYEQWEEPTQSVNAQKGDIWIKSNGIRNYAKAGEYTWDTLGGYAWADFYGSEIYVLDEEGNWVLAGGDQLQNITRTVMEATEDRINLIVDGMSGDYSEFIVELGRIHSRVTSVEEGLSSTIEQTASMIRSAVWTANSEMYSEILQTQSMIRSEVANTESNLRTTITQTASGIWTAVGQKSTVYVQWADPSTSHTIYEGDIWIKTNKMRTYTEMGAKTWNALSGYTWSDFYGSKHYIWTDGAWRLMASEQLENINHAFTEETEDRIRKVVEDMNGNYSEFLQEKDQIRSTVRNLSEDLGSTISQTASEIRSDVYAAKSSLYSTIQQTASSIRMEVASTKSSLSSSITQTATQIRSEVNAAKSTIYSTITQTASSIRSEVASVESDIMTSITQTASGIYTEVGKKATIYTQWTNPAVSHTIHTGDMWIKANNLRTWYDLGTQTWSAMSGYTWSDFYGSVHYIWENGAWKQISNEQLENINHEFTEETDERFRRVLEDMAGNYSEFLQEKDEIRSTVRNMTDDLGSTIDQTASSIRSDVYAANSTIYSTIQQTASSIRMEVANVNSDLSSSITQTATSIRSEVNAAKSSIYSSITQTASNIRLEVASAKSDLSSSIEQTATSIRADVNAANSTIYSSIEQTASGIRQEVANTTSSIRASITTQANRISLVVEGTGSNAKIKPASIVSSINDSGSTVKISAMHVNLDGYVTATGFSTVLANLSSAHINKLYVDTNIYGPNGNSIYTLGLMGVTLSSSGNTYTLKQQTLDGTETTIGTFSRAISSWTWGGGDGKINVQALPQSQTKSVNLSISGPTSVTSNGSKTYTVMYENSDGDEFSTGATLSVNVGVTAAAPDCLPIASDITSAVYVRSKVSGGTFGNYKTLGMSSGTYTPQGSGNHECIVVKDGETVVGRYDIQTTCNNHEKTGWNDCRAQFLASTTTLWSIKKRTMTIDDVGREFYIRDSSYTAYTYDPGEK